MDSAVVGRLAAALGVLVAVAGVVPVVAAGDAAVGIYYGAGAVGLAGVAFLGLLAAVVVLAGERGNADPVTAAGIALVLGVVALVAAALWATGVESELFYERLPGWLEPYRWVVVAAAALLAGATGAYARSALD
jgi:energy-converting hydrogenase Eha subunit B